MKNTMLVTTALGLTATLAVVFVLLVAAYTVVAIVPVTSNESLQVSVATINQHPVEEETLAEVLEYVDYFFAIQSRLESEYPRMAEEEQQEITLAITNAARQWDVDPWLIYSVITVESHFRTDAIGTSGEIGLMQPMPRTARIVATNTLAMSDYTPENLYDPTINVSISTAHLAYLLDLYKGDVSRALVAYNAGTNTANEVRETSYSRKVLTYYNLYTDKHLMVASN